MHKVHGIELRSVPEHLGALGVEILGQFGVQELEVLDGVGSGVVVHLGVTLGTIVGPAISSVERVQVVAIGFEASLGVFGAVPGKSEVCKDAKP